MIDLTDAMRAIQPQWWTPSDALRTLLHVAERRGGSVDVDVEERWRRLIAGNRMIAMAHMTRPLLFEFGNPAVRIAVEPGRPVLVEARGFDDPDFTADRAETIVALADEPWPEEGFSFRQFSAGDLWWASI